MKRATDIAGALLGILLLAPLWALIALWIKLDSRGPVFFRLRVAGKDGRPFEELKFRTRVDGAMEIGLGRETSATDPRITRAGRWLRRTSLDETPQLLNVLRGEMSLVGPRATFLEVAAQYDQRERRRLSVPPGITGLAQVRGRNSISWPERVQCDLWYVTHHSYWLDWKILLETPRALFARRDIYGPGGQNRPPNPLPGPRPAGFPTGVGRSRAAPPA